MIKRITRHYYYHYSICLLLVSAFCVRAGAQTFAEPEQEQLLNGLKVVLWQRPGDPNVLLKLRINSGAAFDLAGKDGTMALLGDVLFPDPATREYVTEQLGGQLEVSTNYDGIDVLVSGKATEFERIVELLRGALVMTRLKMSPAFAKPESNSFQRNRVRPILRIGRSQRVCLASFPMGGRLAVASKVCRK